MTREQMLEEALLKIVGLDSQINASANGNRDVVYGPFALIANAALSTPKAEVVEPVATVSEIRAAGSKWHGTYPTYALDKIPVGTRLYTAPVPALAAGEEAGGVPMAWIFEWKPSTNNNPWQTAVSLAKPSPRGHRDYRNVRPLYAHPTPSPIVDDAMLDRASWAEAYYRDRPRHIWLSEILNAALSGAREGGE